MGGRGWAGWSGVRGGEWENCNSIINKYIKKKKLKWRHPIINVWIGFLECKANLDSKKGGQMIEPKETPTFKRARELKNKQ